MNYRFLPPVMADDGDVALAEPAAFPRLHVADALAPEACRELAAAVLQGHAAGLSWESRTRYAPAAAASWDVNRRFRSSRNAPPTLPGLEAAYAAMEAEACKALPLLVAGTGRVALEGVEEQCILYFTGDHLADHADNAAAAAGDDGTLKWHVTKPERQLSAVMWLTAQTADGTGEFEFAGGELRFNSLVEEDSGKPFTVRPAAGTMVVFPATPWFRHEVLPVRAGTRIALTRWWRMLPDGQAG